MIGIGLGIHVLLTLLIGGLSLLLKKDKTVLAVTLAICFFLPIGGYVFVLLFLVTKGKESKEMEEDLFEQEIFLFTERLQKKDTSMVIPLEDSLLLNDNETKRKKMGDILRENPLDYIHVLQRALQDQDIETSHYASSAISEVKRKLNLQLQKYNVAYQQKKEDVPFLEEYADILKTYLSSRLLDKYSYKRYLYLYLEVMEQLTSQAPTEKHYDQLIDICFENDEIGRAGKYVTAFFDFKECEASFLGLMRYFYRVGDREKFWETLARLRSSSISLSQEGLETVRFWLEVNHA